MKTNLKAGISFSINAIGISRLRAVVLYELQSALSQYARKKYHSGEITQAHLKNIYKVSSSYGSNISKAVKTSHPIKLRCP